MLKTTSCEHVAGEVEHECDNCSKEPSQCLCNHHLELIKQESYDEGYKAHEDEIGEIKETDN